MELRLDTYHTAREKPARLDGLKEFMKNQQTIQMEMQQTQHDFIEQQAICMQQVLQRMAKTQVDDTRHSDEQPDDQDGHRTKQQHKHEIKQQDKQDQDEDELLQLGILSSSAVPAVGAW